MRVSISEVVRVSISGVVRVSISGVVRVSISGVVRVSGTPEIPRFVLPVPPPTCGTGGLQ